jgi:predicted amidohydrolase YtcJ
VHPAIAIVNGRVWTGDPARPRAEAVAIRGHRIVAVGTTAEIRALGAADQEVDAQGATVAPGFIDAHLHLVAGGFRLTSVQLRDVRSKDEFIARVRAHAAARADGTWITGGDWNQENWNGEMPTRDWIDAVTPNHPVWIGRLDGHSALANSLALRLAGVTRATAPPAGGTIVRDDLGEPTGLLKENAMALVADAVPRPAAADEDAALEAAMRYVAAQGVTSAHHMGAIPTTGTWADVEVFRRAHRRRALRTRVRAVAPLESWPRLRELIASGEAGGPDGCGDEWLRLGVLKSFLDGTIGSHTAAFHEPFTDAPGERGLFVNDEAQMRQWMIDADAAGLQLAVHAIGDHANTVLLNLFSDVAAANGPRDRRFRAEHAQHLKPHDIPRFAKVGAVASMQPYHAVDDGRWAERVIGHERARTSYAWRAVLDAGTRLAFGSDWFVAPPTPIDGLAAAVTRRTLDGRNPDGWIPEQRISLDEALHAYTTGAAYVAFEEHVKGRLEPGFLADVVVLDRDLFKTSAEQLASARVMMTVIDGTVAFEA